MISATATILPPRHALASGSLAVAAIATATLLWGTSTPVAKLALGQWPPLTQAWLRFVVALALLIPLVYAGGTRPALGRMPALLGLFGVALFYALHNLGLHATSAINASLILDGGTPALTIAFGAALLGERPRRLPAAGLLISLLGVGLVVLAATPRGIGAIGHGDLLMLVSAALWALYAVAGRSIFARQGVVPVVTGSTLYGALFLTPAALAELASTGTPRVTAPGLGMLLFLGLGCSALAYLLFAHALTHLSAWQIASWTTLMPVVGVVAAAVLLQEPILLAQVGGGALVLLGVFLASQPESASDTSSPSAAPPRPPASPAPAPSNPPPNHEPVIWPSAPERKQPQHPPAAPLTGEKSPPAEARRFT